jgi:lysine-arginine-ornithine-binding protein
MKLFNKWLMPIAAVIFSSQVLAADASQITLATEATYPPFESINNQGQMVGFDVDVLKAICLKIQKNCRFINQPWDSLIPGLELGKFNVIFGAMNITEERKKQVSFTEPYYLATGALVAPKSMQLSMDPQVLKNKTIGVQQSTTYEDYLRTVYGKDIQIKRYASLEDAFLDLQSGRIDAVFGDSPVILAWVKSQGDNSSYQVAGVVKDAKYFNSGYGFAMKKTDTDLVNQFNQGLTAIKADGSYQKIVQQYFGSSQ